MSRKVHPLVTNKAGHWYGEAPPWFLEQMRALYGTIADDQVFREWGYEADEASNLARVKQAFEDRNVDYFEKLARAVAAVKHFEETSTAHDRVRCFYVSARRELEREKDQITKGRLQRRTQEMCVTFEYRRDYPDDWPSEEEIQSRIGNHPWPKWSVLHKELGPLGLVDGKRGPKKKRR